MLAVELEAVPWPALLVSAAGTVLAASPAAVALLGMRPDDAASMELRFEFLSPSGEPIPEDDRPLRRTARAELFEVQGIWRDRGSGRELALRARGRAVGSHGLLELDSLSEDAERRATARLARLNEALLGRTPGEGLISIRELLLQLVLQACELTGARYGALGVLERDRATLKDFVHVGVPEETARAIGHLPQGKGLLGAVIQEARTIRVPDIAADSRSAGFPASHPPMTSFLGVPLRVGEQVFGNFYLTDKQGAARSRRTTRGSSSGSARRRRSPSPTHARRRRRSGGSSRSSSTTRPTGSSTSPPTPGARCWATPRRFGCSGGSRAGTIRRARTT